MFLQNTPIRRKLMVTMMMASGAVLILTCAVFFGVEFVALRRAMVAQMDILGDVIASNSAASLAFQSTDDAQQILSALRANPHIDAAALYTEDGKLFASYPSGLDPKVLPAGPGAPGQRFVPKGLVSFQVVKFDQKRLGMLYLHSDLAAISERLWLYSEIVLVILAAAFGVAYLMAHILQRQISTPILALEKTARIVSEQHDYTVRATKQGDDEMGRLTDTFNQMLGQIAELNRDLERRVDERTAELTAVNKDLESFSYSVSHDLRAPLRHIGGFATMLERHAGGTLDEKGKRYMTVIIDSTQRMGRLIDDLLIFARHGRSEMRREAVNLDNLVAEIRQGLQAECAGRNIVWKVSPLPVVHGDLGLLRQVFANLISNAVKYSRKREEARIEIDATTVANEVVISIRDNGAGFDMKYLDKLFGVFQRLHRDDQFEGTGVGLALVRRIIQRHGGRVWAEGKVDVGATFSVALPVISPGSNPPVAPPAPSSS